MLKFKYETVAVAVCSVTGQCRYVCCDMHKGGSVTNRQGVV